MSALAVTLPLSFGGVTVSHVTRRWMKLLGGRITATVN